MAPVAEVTYFDSGTIEYPTYRVVAAKEYSDGSAGGGGSPRVCGNTPREVAGSMLSRCHGHQPTATVCNDSRERERGTRRERAVARSARVPNPHPHPTASFLLPCPILDEFEKLPATSLRETRRSPKKRNAGRIGIQGE